MKFQNSRQGDNGKAHLIRPAATFSQTAQYTTPSGMALIPAGSFNRVRNDPEWFRKPYDEMVLNEGYAHSFERFIADLPNEIPRRFEAFKKLYRRAQIQGDLKSINEASEYVGSLCVSKPNDSIAMWSHYAKHNQGIALGLDLSHACFSNSGFAGEFGDVKYEEERCQFGKSRFRTNHRLW